jgi:hypothetical protein
MTLLTFGGYPQGVHSLSATKVGRAKSEVLFDFIRSQGSKESDAVASDGSVERRGRMVRTSDSTRGSWVRRHGVVSLSKIP